MGLSDSERIQKTIWAVHSIVTISKSALIEIGRDDFDMFNIKPLFEKGLSLWRAILSDKGNSGFWFIGSDSEVGFSKTSLFSIALYDNIKKPSPSLFEIENDIDKIDFKFFSERFSLEGFLNNRDRKVYDLYIWCQEVQYAVNRYDDKLAKSYLKLMDEISDMMGMIFGIFNKNDEFAKAWLWVEICKSLFPIGWWYKSRLEQDTITKLMLDQYLYHEMTTSNWTIDQLREILKSLTEDQSNKNRFKNLVELVSGKLIITENVKKACKQYQYPLSVVKTKIKKAKKIKELQDNNYSKEFVNERKRDREDLLDIEV